MITIYLLKVLIGMLMWLCHSLQVTHKAVSVLSILSANMLDTGKEDIVACDNTIVKLL
jgi:hypothetical protein